jgi:hypothetical protein
MPSPRGARLFLRVGNLYPLLPGGIQPTEAATGTPEKKAYGLALFAGFRYALCIAGRLGPAACGSRQPRGPHTAGLSRCVQQRRSCRIDPYVRTYDPSKSGDPYLKFRNEWGGLRLLTIDSSDASYIAFTARQIGAPVLIMGSLTPGNA